MIAAPDACDLTAEERVERMARSRRGIDLQELFFAQDAARVAASPEFEQQGYHTPLEWIRHETRMESGEAANAICVGEQMEAIANSVGAMVNGEIGYAHLVVIARTAEALRSSPTSTGFDEHKVLERAKTEENLTQFRRFCPNHCHAMDPEAYIEEEIEGVEARRLEISGAGQGMVYIKGMLDPAAGAALRTMLEPLARKTDKDDERSRDRRVADALVEITNRMLDSGTLPIRDGQRPHLQVTATLETLLGIPGSPAADMEFSLPISAKQVERIACDCSVTRILLGPASTVIDVGRSKRVVTPAQRKAPVARDQHCAWPGCDRPVSFTNAHHLVHWIHGGPTDLPNLALICYRHHFMVHELGWQLVRSSDGRLIAIPRQDFGTATARGPD
jgi:hypothetical protein